MPTVSTKRSDSANLPDHKVQRPSPSPNERTQRFKLWLMQTLLKDFGKDAAAQISIGFHQIGASDPARPGSGDVCILNLKLSPRPRFVVENGQELFYVRTGNATNQLKPSELLGYGQTRWPATAGAALSTP